MHKGTVSLKIIEKNVNRMSMSSDCHLQKRWQLDDTPIQLLFPKQNENRMKLIQLSCCQIGKTPRLPSIVPKIPNQLL